MISKTESQRYCMACIVAMERVLVEFVIRCTRLVKGLLILRLGCHRISGSAGASASAIDNAIAEIRDFERWICPLG
jgi:hypothetical protein